MKQLFLVAVLMVAAGSCKSKKVVDDPATYPKDIALKPDKTFENQQDSRKLDELREKINRLANSETCTDETAWRISPVGAKACGGPAAYIAYPKSKEDSIIPLIQNYTSEQADFNKKYGISSDCMIVEPPAGIRCSEGKAMLLSSAAQ